MKTVNSYSLVPSILIVLLHSAGFTSQQQPPQQPQKSQSKSPVPANVLPPGVSLESQCEMSSKARTTVATPLCTVFSAMSTIIRMWMHLLSAVPVQFAVSGGSAPCLCLPLPPSLAHSLCLESRARATLLHNCNIPNSAHSDLLNVDLQAEPGVPLWVRVKRALGDARKCQACNADN